MHRQCAEAHASSGPGRWSRACVWLLAPWLVLACSLDGEGTGDKRVDVAPSGTPASDAAAQGPSSDAGASSPDGSKPALDSDAGPLDAATADASVDTRGDAARGNAGADAGLLPDGALPAGSCRVEGAYALRIEYDVSWPTTYYGASPVFAAGSGTVQFLAKLTLSSTASGPRAAIAPCGTTLPDFAGGSPGYTTERYNAYIPSASWNAPTMPSWSLAYQASCSDPGCTLQVDPLFAVLGGRPTGGFDAAGNPLIEHVDQDADGQLGITYISRGPPELNAANRPYSYITLGYSARARKLDMLLGFAGAIAGRYESCDVITGTALGANTAEFALGCTGVVNNTLDEVECDGPTADFLASTLPVWSVTATRVRIERVAENSCNTVRSVLRD
ncbi:MAG: hypothetical protein JWN48_209 [Myxococcaceae bacterium]|nr:hypothetical protein [Myxococcaceae bacterium]